MQRKLTGRRGKALNALLGGSTVTQAATAAGVDRSTLWRWFQDDDFADALQTGAIVAYLLAARRLQIAADIAATAIVNALINPTEPGTAARLRAADMALTHAGKLAETLDILARLDALEGKS